MELGRGDEVALASGPGSGSAVVATVGRVQGELHEASERHRAGPPDLVADAIEELGVLADVAQVGRGFAAQPGSEIVHQDIGRDRRGPRASRRPGPTRVCPPSITGIGASAAATVSARNQGSAMRSWSSRSDANRSPGVGQARSSAPSRWASSTRVSRTAASASRASEVRSAAGPSRSRSMPSTDAGGRWSATVVRRPRSSMRARVRDAVRRSTQRNEADDVRPDTNSSDRASATTARMASRRVWTLARSSGPSQRAHRPPSSTRSSGLSMSTPSRQRLRRSVTGTPAVSASHRGRALSVARSGASWRMLAALEIAMASAENRSLASAAGALPAVHVAGSRPSRGRPCRHLRLRRQGPGPDARTVYRRAAPTRRVPPTRRPPGIPRDGVPPGSLGQPSRRPRADRREAPAPGAG